MAQDIWEGADLLVSAAVTSEPAKPYTGTVDLLLIKNGADDKPIARQDGLALTGGKLTHSFKVPDVAPDEPHYSLKVIAVYGPDKQTRSDVAEAVVWPRAITLHTRTDTQPNEPKVPLLVVQGDTEGAKPVSGADGKATATLALKAPYVIKTGSPYSILADEIEPAKLRDHKLKVERNIVAMFVSPDVTQAPYVANDASAPAGGQRQFVNLVTARNGQDAQGHLVTFVVCANPKADGRANDRIYVEVAFGHQSKRNNPKPALLAEGVSDLKNTPDPATFSGWVKLDADAGSARFKVDLGLAGGDTCSVAIGGRKDHCTDASITLVNWRRLFYELRYPALMAARLSAAKDYADDIRAHLTARLGHAFIDFERFKSHEFPDADATIAKANGTLMAAAYLQDAGGGQRYVLTNGILNTAGKFSGDAAKKSRSVYVSLCDRAFSSNSTAHTLAPLVDATPFELASPGGYLFEPSTKDGSANLKVGSYKWKAVVANAHLHKTVLAVEPPANDAAASQVTLTETRRPGKTLDLRFAAKGDAFETSLAPADTLKINAFISGLLSDLPALRQVGNQVSLKLAGDGPGADAQARLQAVGSAVQAAFDSSATLVDCHPGKDAHGVVREGPMDLAWLKFKDYRTILINLPKSPPATAAHLRTLPGDFVGAAETDTNCKVQVKFDFSSAGEINGNSGGGEQIMVLRTATAGAISSTICHELGHAMGMTIVPGLNNDKPPPGLTVQHIDNGGTSYVNGNAPYPLTDGKRSIHKGGHCAHQVPGGKRADAAFAGWEPSLAVTGCILWGSGGSDDTRTAFCPTCVEFIKARRLDDIRAGWGSRGADQG